MPAYFAAWNRLQNARWLEQNDPRLASAITSLPWVADGIDGAETDVVQDLLYIAFTSRPAASSIVEFEWVRDGVTDLEAEAIGWINNFSNARVVESVVALDWIEDGIEALEAETVEELSYIDYDDAMLASSVVALPWVQDGIDDIEFEAINWINNFDDAEVALSVVELGWVRDGIEELEVKAIEKMSYISNADADEAQRIVAMQFLDSLEPSDVAALESLSRLASFRKDDFRRVMAHPTLRDGIWDGWAKVVATLYGVSDTNPALIDALLDPDRVTLNNRIIDLPRAGEVELAIIRTDQGSVRSMDLLEHAVRNIEEFMAFPLPTGYVGLLFGNAVLGDFAGTNFGTHMAILSKYDIHDDGSYEAEYAGRLIAHEVAHYYWSGNSDWVDEGAADLVGSISEYVRAGKPVGVTNDPCGYARTIAELERLVPEKMDDAFTCNYALGERLFIDLYRELGDIAFRQGLRDLYLLSEVKDETQEGTSVGIEHVKMAFKADGAGIAAPIVDKVAARWYDGTVPYDTSARDAEPADPRFRTAVNGSIDEAYLAVAEDGQPATSFSVGAVSDWLWLYLHYNYSVGSDTEVTLELVDYFEDGFVFDRRTVSFTASPQYIGGSWWLTVGQSPDDPWAPGQYRVYVYNEGRKLIELEYEVTP